MTKVDTLKAARRKLFSELQEMCKSRCNLVTVSPRPVKVARASAKERADIRGRNKVQEKYFNTCMRNFRPLLPVPVPATAPASDDVTDGIGKEHKYCAGAIPKKRKSQGFEEDKDHAKKPRTIPFSVGAEPHPGLQESEKETNKSVLLVRNIRAFGDKPLPLIQPGPESEVEKADEISSQHVDCLKSVSVQLNQNLDAKKEAFPGGTISVKPKTSSDDVILNHPHSVPSSHMVVSKAAELQKEESYSSQLRRDGNWNVIVKQEKEEGDSCRLPVVFKDQDRDSESSEPEPQCCPVSSYSREKFLIKQEPTLSDNEDGEQTVNVARNTTKRSQTVPPNKLSGVSLVNTSEESGSFFDDSSGSLIHQTEDKSDSSSDSCEIILADSDSNSGDNVGIKKEKDLQMKQLSSEDDVTNTKVLWSSYLSHQPPLSGGKSEEEVDKVTVMLGDQGVALTDKKKHVSIIDEVCMKPGTDSSISHEEREIGMHVPCVQPRRVVPGHSGKISGGGPVTFTLNSTPERPVQTDFRTLPECGQSIVILNSQSSLMSTVLSTQCNITPVNIRTIEPKPSALASELTENAQALTKFGKGYFKTKGSTVYTLLNKRTYVSKEKCEPKTARLLFSKLNKGPNRQVSPDCVRSTDSERPVLQSPGCGQSVDSIVNNEGKNKPSSDWVWTVKTHVTVDDPNEELSHKANISEASGVWGPLSQSLSACTGSFGDVDNVINSANSREAASDSNKDSRLLDSCEKHGEQTSKSFVSVASGKKNRGCIYHIAVKQARKGKVAESSDDGDYVLKLESALH